MTEQNTAGAYHTDMPAHDYHAAEGISNSGLLLVERNPGDLVWSREAPADPSKSGDADFGTALHTALLEPEKFEGSFIVGPTKSRDTKAFMEFEQEHGAGKLVLLESEYDKIRLMRSSCEAHPAFRRYLGAQGNCEASVFVPDTVIAGDAEVNITRRIRIDKDLTPAGMPLLADLKTTSDINDWREPVRWKNPLFKFNYGHTAAYYLETASLYYGVQYDEYCFLLVQKNAEMGRYPVAIFTITRQELEEYGFFDRVRSNLELYASCKASDDWFGVERFPILSPNQ